MENSINWQPQICTDIIFTIRRRFSTFASYKPLRQNRRRRERQKSVGASHPVDAIPENSVIEGGLIFRHFFTSGNFVSACRLNSGELFPLLFPKFFPISSWILHMLCKLNSLFVSLPLLLLICTPHESENTSEFSNSQKKKRKE